MSVCHMIAKTWLIIGPIVIYNSLHRHKIDSYSPINSRRFRWNRPDCFPISECLKKEKGGDEEERQLFSDFFFLSLSFFLFLLSRESFRPTSLTPGACQSGTVACEFKHGKSCFRKCEDCVFPCLLWGWSFVSPCITEWRRNNSSRQLRHRKLWGHFLWFMG